MSPTAIDTAATVLFALAVLHTFSVKRFSHLAEKYRQGSIGENFFHLLAEVEVVFAIWAGFFLLFMVWKASPNQAVLYLESLDFTEPAFVFVIMTVAATRPIISVANGLISAVARVVPLPGEIGFIFTCLVLGPLLGSFITEPAAMTVTALILKDRLFEAPEVDRKVKYLALGTLFVNVSIGGVLTPFAAPPVLMVAKTWGWDLPFMMGHFGPKAMIAVTLNSALLVFLGWPSLARLKTDKSVVRVKRGGVPVWLSAIHLLVLGMVVITSHHPIVFTGAFLFFLGVTTVTQEYQAPIKLRESLLVASFLGGLVVLGGPQEWWLQPVLSSMSETALYFGAAALTAITDNAALTYLGSQVEGLSDAMKYVLVAGAVTGGGLTVIANAPNPAGYSILHKSFGREGVSPLGLLAGALGPTVIALICFWVIPHISI